MEMESNPLKERSTFKAGYNGAMGVGLAIVTVVMWILAVPLALLTFMVVVHILIALGNMCAPPPPAVVEKKIKPDKVVVEKIAKPKEVVGPLWIEIGEELPKERIKSPWPQPRWWTSRDGERMVEARFVCYGFGEVRLRRLDLTVVKWPFDQLSDVDQKYVKDRRCIRW